MRSKSQSKGVVTTRTKTASDSSESSKPADDVISRKESRRLKKLAMLDALQHKSDNDSESDVDDETTDDDVESGGEFNESAAVYANNPLLPGPSYNEESDSSDEEDLRNTIGNVPVRWYDEYDHIGYDHEGRAIGKQASGRGAIDEFLARMEDPDYWRTVKDRQTGGELRLTDEQVGQINNMQRGRYPSIGFNPYEPYVDLFSAEESVHPVTNQVEHKRSFIPSRLDARRVGKLVYAMKMGWIKAAPFERRAKKTDMSESFAPVTYDLWDTAADEATSKSALARLRAHIPAPQVALPGHIESYNPPAEYLFDDAEKEKWDNATTEERETTMEPAKYSMMRHIPGYERYMNERHERCMDLFLAPRQRKMRLNVRPEDLLPPLPKPSDLQPFPAKLSTTMSGHTMDITGMAMEPVIGSHVATCSLDGKVRVYHLGMGLCVREVDLGEPCADIVWMHTRAHSLVAVASGCSIHLLNIGVGSETERVKTDKYMTSLVVPEVVVGDDPLAIWTTTPDHPYKRMSAKMNTPIARLTSHVHGDYLATVNPSAGNKSVALHQLSKMKSQAPFAKSKGVVQVVDFHKNKPWLFVVTKEHVRVYDLVKQSLVKKMLTNCKAITSLAVHPADEVLEEEDDVIAGDNLLVGSGDSRVTWLDLDLSSKPHHKAGVRSVAFHERLPLFASASDDGTVLVCHGNVYNDLLTNALIVPVKSLSAPGAAHVTKVVFHPSLPWLVTANSDRKLRLYVF